MTGLIFPSLRGQGWSVHKKPKFDTKVAPHATGREARAGKYAAPLWDFELTFDGLDMTATGTYGSLGAQSMQTLAGFFLQMQGKANPFVYVDPTDNLVTNATVATGDGVTTTFVLARPMGVYAEPVGALISVSAVRLNGANTFGWVAQQPNIINFGTPPAAGVVITADFKFGYACRFSEDIEDFEEFMSMLSGVKTLTFQSVRDIVPLEITALRVIVIKFPIGASEFCAPSDWNNNYNKIEMVGGGQSAGGTNEGTYPGNGAGGGGGAYTFRTNVELATGQCVPIYIGAGGVFPPTGSGDYGQPGIDTSFGSSTDTFYILAKAGGTVGTETGGIGYQCIPPGTDGGGGGGIGVIWGGSGGGGAAGPNGPGGNGSQCRVSLAGGGGGGADGGGSALNVTGLDGAAGGAARDGTPGGVGGTASAPDGGDGANGSGGGGGHDTSYGRAGRASSTRQWYSDGVWYGLGSGAGAAGEAQVFPPSGTLPSGPGADGGQFGGGGGAGSPPGKGGDGLIVITYLGLESS